MESCPIKGEQPPSCRPPHSDSISILLSRVRGMWVISASPTLPAGGWPHNGGKSSVREGVRRGGGRLKSLSSNHSALHASTLFAFAFFLTHNDLFASNYGGGEDREKMCKFVPLKNGKMGKLPHECPQKQHKSPLKQRAMPLNVTVFPSNCSFSTQGTKVIKGYD